MVLLQSLEGLLGNKAHAFSLKGTNDSVYSLSDFDETRVLVIVFMCNHCPYVQAIWSKLVALQAKYQGQGVRFVGINPNVGHPDYEEETFEKMKEYYDLYNMNFPYLEDSGQKVAREYQAQCTPDIYVYDGGRELVYHGRVDDARPGGHEATSNDLDDALCALVDGEKPKKEQNFSMGCSIKWYN